MKTNDEEELDSAGHPTRRLESDFVSGVLSLFSKGCADISHVCMPHPFAWSFGSGGREDVSTTRPPNSQIVPFRANQRRRV